MRGAALGPPPPGAPSWLAPVDPIPELPSRAFALTRRQFAADVLLGVIPDAARGAAVVGLTEVDLFLEGRPFVFGASIPVRGVALVSAARLGAVPGRLEKVCRHELGHLAGLDDCFDRCLMKPASDPTEIDTRPTALCPRCNTHLAALPLVR